MSRKKISTTVYITPEQDEQLKKLHERTKVPVAEFICPGIDLVLEKYGDHLLGRLDVFTGRLSDAKATPRCRCGNVSRGRDEPWCSDKHHALYDSIPRAR